MAFIRVKADKAHRFGIAAVDDEDGERGGRVTAYWEKPDRAGVRLGLTDGPLLQTRGAVSGFSTENQEDTSYEFGRDIIPMLMKEGGRVYGYKFCGYWGYTRTIEEYWQSNMDLLGEKPLIDMEKWGLRTNLDHRGIRDFQPVLMGDYAAVHNSLVYNGCQLSTEPSAIPSSFPGSCREGGGGREFRTVFQ